MELSQKLKELRKKQGLTQLELAERLFVSRQAISGWEAGTSRPSTENLQSLSRLFNIPLETLLDDTAEAEPAAAPEKLPAEEQAKEEGKGQGLGKDRRYKAIVLVIVLLAILLTDGNYPVSDKGKTYGSALLSEIVGHEPDLISAVGTDGQAGYVKYEDVKKPEIKNPSEAVSYMQDRLETYTVPLYDLQEEVIGEFEIGCAMDVTGYSLEEAKEMVNLGERAGSVLSVEQTSLINGNFPKNVRGETYGTALMAEVVGEMPDLQAAIGTNDQEGYVRTSDLSHPKFETPQDALEWQKTQPDSYYIPLYDFQGNEIGSFLRERNNLTIAEMEAMKG